MSCEISLLLRQLQLLRQLLQTFHLGLGGTDSLVKRHHLILRRNHAHNIFVISELQLGNALKTLLEMRLNTHRIFRLRQNLKQLVVRQEEEPATLPTPQT